MQTIKIPNADVIQAPPVGQPPLPGQLPPEGSKPPETGQKPPSGGIPNVVPESEAFKAVEGAKFTTLTPLSGDGSQNAQMGNSVPVGGLIDGGLAIELMDALLPSVLVAVMAAIGAQMKKTDLQLTAREKTTLTPLMQKCMDQLMINFQNPFAALGISMLIIYGAKITEHGVIQMIDKKAEKAAADRLRKENQTTPAQTAAPVQSEILKPAHVVNMNVNQGQRKPIDINYKPTDEEMFMARKIMPKKSTKDMIARIQREKAAGTLDQFLRGKQKR